MKQKFFVTFGIGHYPYGSCYSVIEAETEAEARVEIYRHICTHWCTTYNAERFIDQPERYNLTEVPWETIKLAPPMSANWPERPCARGAACPVVSRPRPEIGEVAEVN